MNIAEKIRIFLDKLRSLPEDKKKIILWVVVIVIGIPMAFFWVKGSMDNLSKMSKSVQEIKLPEINTPTMPNLELEKLGEKLNEALQKETANNSDQIK